MSADQEAGTSKSDERTPDPNNVRAVYGELVKSYHAIDSFRGMLLGLLPFATGAGIFLLYNGGSKIPTEAMDFLPAIGLFGFLITLGLFAFEMYGVKKCHALINTGQDLEAHLGVAGQFTSRPEGLGGLINEPFASGIIYPAVAAAWLFVALAPALPQPAWLAWLIAGVVFVGGLAASIGYNAHLRMQDEQRGRTSPSAQPGVPHGPLAVQQEERGA